MFSVNSAAEGSSQNKEKLDEFEQEDSEGKEEQGKNAKKVDSVRNSKLEMSKSITFILCFSVENLLA